MKSHAPLLVALTLAACAVITSGCSRTSKQPVVLDDWPGETIANRPDARPKNPAPDGPSKTPALKVFQEGIASWYGPNFHGRLTSNQETFDMHQFTAAHRSLPLPSYARVSHLGNGRSVVVRINDRGPFKDNRLIDLSFAAAKALDMVDEGTARVRVSVLAAGPETADRPVVTSAPGIYLQLGAFGSRANAMTLLKRLRQGQIPEAHIQTVSPAEGQFVHRVRIGPLADVDTADELVATITVLGLERPRVVFE